MGRGRGDLEKQHGQPRPAFGSQGNGQKYKQGDGDVDEREKDLGGNPPVPPVVPPVVPPTTPVPPVAPMTQSRKIPQRRSEGVQKGLRLNSVADALLYIASFRERRPQKDIASDLIIQALWDRYGDEIDLEN